MEPHKAVFKSAIYIPGLDITPEEKTQHKAKFTAWYDNFKQSHQMPSGEERKQHEANYQNWLGEMQEKHPIPEQRVGC